MHPLGRIALVGHAALVLCTGCAMVGDTPRFYRAPTPTTTANSAQPAVASTNKQPNTASPSTAAAADTSKPASEGPAAPNDAKREWPQLVAQLHEIGALDPEAEAQLIRDLEQTDPALWPQLVRLFRASLEFRRRQDSTVKNDTPPQPASAVAQVETAVASSTQAAPTTDEHVQQASLTTTSPQANETASQSPQAAIEPAAAATPRPAATEPPPQPARRPVGYQALLNETISALEAETTRPPTDAVEAARHVHLRMLYLAAGRRDDAVRPIEGLPASEQDFWTGELYGLAAYLDGDRGPPGRRAAEAAGHLSKALGRLQQTGNLAVRNLAFCTEIVSYGTYTTFDKNEFQPGQQVLLYAEVENFASEESDAGYHTALRSSYQVLDSQGRRVAEQELPLTEETCRNQRRDYFIRFFLWIPKRIYDGRYTLQLTVEDTVGRKIGQSSIEFTICEPASKDK